MPFTLKALPFVKQIALNVWKNMSFAHGPCTCSSVQQKPTTNVCLAASEFSLRISSSFLCLLVFQLHVVHYNSDKYDSFIEARDKPDGLAVLAFFYDVRKTHTFVSFFPYASGHGCSSWWMSISSAEGSLCSEKILFYIFGNALWSEWSVVFPSVMGSKVLLTAWLLFSLFFFFFSRTTQSVSHWFV